MPQAQARTQTQTRKPLNGAAQIKVPPQKPNKLEEAMGTLRAAQDAAMDALGLKPLSPVRKFINFVCASACAGGAYYITMQLVELLVLAAATYIGLSFITFLVAFVGLAAALFVTWQTYAVSRSFLDGVAMGTIKPTDVVKAGWSRVTGVFSREAEAVPA